MKKLERVPDGLKEILEVYGNPDADGDFVLDSEFYESETRLFRLPFPLRLSWNLKQSAGRIRAHRLVGDAMVDALIEIGEHEGYLWLKENNLDIFGGVYNFRKMVGYPALSLHSWGVAIDYVPHIGRQGNKRDAEMYPEFIRDAFVKRGFDWGGAWPEPYTVDAMHFQAATGF